MTLGPRYALLSCNVGIFRVNKVRCSSSGNQALSKLTDQHSRRIQLDEDYPVLHRTSIKVIRYKSI